MSESNVEGRRIRFNRASLLRINPYVFAVAVLLLILCLSWLVPSENLKLGQATLVDLDGPWTVTTADGQIQTLYLPANLDVPVHDVYEAAYTFDQNYPDGQMLRIRASMQTVRVLLDNSLLFLSQKPDSSRLTVPEASVWYFIPLPSDLQGRVLTLQLSSSESSFSGLLNPVSIGTGDALMKRQIEENQFTILIVIFLIGFGILSMSSTFFIRQFHDKRLFYLGLFAILIAIWLFSEAKLMQLLTGNRFWLAAVSYLAIALMPVPFLLYLRAAVLERFSRYLKILAVMFLVYTGIILILQLSGVATFIQSAIGTNALILLTIVTVVACLVYETVKHKNQSVRQFFLAASVLAITVVLEVFNFLNANYDRTSQYGRIGIVVFFMLLSVSSVRAVSRLLDQEKEAALLSRLAYHDIQTGAKNRLAFERDIENLMHNAGEKDFRLVMMDINNLKAINDVYGHRAGDQAIRLCYESIIGGIGETGTCYRIGGDEFACLINPIPDDEFASMHDRIRQELHRQENELPYSLDIAIGSDLYRSKEVLSLSDFLHHVDQLMYDHKRQQKNRRQTADERPVDHKHADCSSDKPVSPK